MYKVLTTDDDELELTLKWDTQCGHQTKWSTEINADNSVLHKARPELSECLALEEWYGLDLDPHVISTATSASNLIKADASVRRRRIATFYGALTLLALGLLGFASFQLLLTLSDRSAILSAPALLVLLFGSLGLLFEFYMGFKADITAMQEQNFERIKETT